MKEQNILITGYPGFLGNYIYRFFHNAGYNVYTLGLLNSDHSHHLVTDISTEVPNIPDVEFDIVIHAAGKAHVVPKTEEEKNLFYKVNLEGTKNLIQSIDKLSTPPKSFIFVSTVAVYGLEEGELLDESTQLNPTTPYGESKKLAEKYINNWKTTTKKMIIRLPLLVGINPPGNLGKMISAIKKGYYFNIAGGKAKRSMVLAEDIAAYLPILAEYEGTYNLTDGYHPLFKELSSAIKSIIKNRKSSCLSIPFPLIKIFAFIGDFIQKITKKSFPVNSLVLKKMTSDLTFSDKKARKDLGWNPQKVLDELANIIEQDLATDCTDEHG